MASRFSGALQLTNLDDFITPSQECIKPIEIDKSKSKTGAKIKIQEDGVYMEVTEAGDAQKLSKVEITLADCLACSGCITSAESVLVTQQSHEELLRGFTEKNERREKEEGEAAKSIAVVSISIQPVLSLAKRYDLEPEAAFRKLSGYFKKLGADVVLDMTAADDFALLESAKEFVKRYQAGLKNLPMLASSCPGWVCYAEKTHGNFILPYISETKSPQQIMGTLVKKYLAETLKIQPQYIYHATVMPCYDKKLEASRADFQEGGVKDVDCVLTAIEVEQILNDEGVSLSQIEEGPIERPFGNYNELNDKTLFGHSGGGSGGYAEFILRYAAKQLFGLADVRAEFRSLRNPDFKEAVLEVNGEIVLRFALVYGFRNIQNLVQKLKRGKSVYHYVEVMACPAGCLNGGAQIRPQKVEVQPRELATNLEEMYQQLPQSEPDKNSALLNLYNTWLEGEFSDKVASLFHTEYHEIPKLNTALSIKW